MEILIPLLNSNWEIIGFKEKIAVHQEGLLHLAFSVLIFNKEGEILLQKRASSKYHSPSLWTNTTCGHPFPEEDIKEAATRRLQEEMGISCNLDYQFTFSYKAAFTNGLVENEVDHVFYGHYDGDVSLHPEEAEDYKWMTKENIKTDIKESPENYTVWFREIMNKI